MAYTITTTNATGDVYYTYPSTNVTPGWSDSSTTMMMLEGRLKIIEHSMLEKSIRDARRADRMEALLTKLAEKLGVRDEEAC